MLFSLEKNNIKDLKIINGDLIEIPYFCYCGRENIQVTSFFIEYLCGEQPKKIKFNLNYKNNSGKKISFETKKISKNISLFYLLYKNKKLIGNFEFFIKLSNYLDKNFIEHGNNEIIDLYFYIINKS